MINRKKRRDAAVLKTSYKDSPLDKAVSIVNTQINLLVEKVKTCGLLELKEAEILIKYTKLLTELDDGKNKELQELKKLSKDKAKKLLLKETNDISE
jgi:hypothetical protein